MPSSTMRINRMRLFVLFSTLFPFVTELYIRTKCHSIASRFVAGKKIAIHTIRSAHIPHIIRIISFWLFSFRSSKSPFLLMFCCRKCIPFIDFAKSRKFRLCSGRNLNSRHVNFTDVEGKIDSNTSHGRKSKIREFHHTRHKEHAKSTRMNEWFHSCQRTSHSIRFDVS